MIKAGCRYFTSAEARTHWTATRGGTQNPHPRQTRKNERRNVRVDRYLRG